MKKYKGYYYTTRHTGVKKRNNSVSIKTYSWAIRNKEGEILESSEQELDSKQEAEIEAEEHIDEYYR